jgi:hypothetical protein
MLTKPHPVMELNMTPVTIRPCRGRTGFTEF